MHETVTRRLALLTTWAARCGVAEYSRSLVEALAGHGVRVTVLAPRRQGPAGVPFIPPAGGATVQEIWEPGRIDPAAVVHACRAGGLSTLVIQYHNTFFGPDALLATAAHAARAGLAVTVTLHNSRQLDVDWLHRFDRLGVSLLVHAQPEWQRLVDLGVVNVAPTAIGTLDIPYEPAEEVRERLGLFLGPVVGTFGFLRPHKGVLELIRAAALLRDLGFPGVTLLCLTALYPSPDSEPYLAECRHAARRLGLDHQVHLHTGFQDIEEAVRDLHACDVIALPYHASNEGSSAAAHAALAARRPLLTTRQEIFEGLESVAYPVESAAPPVLAAALAVVLANPFLRQSLKRRGEAYLAQTAWRRVAGDYVRAAFGPAAAELCATGPPVV